MFFKKSFFLILLVYIFLHLFYAGESGTAENPIIHDIYFIRHAETEKNAGISHNENVFSPDGKGQVERLTKELLSRGIKFDYLFISPAWRARETIIPYLASSPHRYGSVDLYIENRIKECCWDEASDNSHEVKSAAEDIKKLLKNQREGKRILIVGHYYSGKILLEKLLGIKTLPANAVIIFGQFAVSVDGTTKKNKHEPFLKEKKNTLHH